MPECVVNEVKVDLSEKERQAYDTMRAELVLSLNGEEVDAGNAAALANKLSQMANGAVYGEDKRVLRLHDRKLDALEDLIEAANGKPVLVAYWFKHDLERIQERFIVREIKTSRDIADWNQGKIPVAVIHPASAGHGLNLQSGGSTLVWFGLTWSLELYQQTNARLWRQGQKDIFCGGLPCVAKSCQRSCGWLWSGRHLPSSWRGTRKPLWKPCTKAPSGISKARQTQKTWKSGNRRRAVYPAFLLRHRPAGLYPGGNHAPALWAAAGSVGVPQAVPRSGEAKAGADH